MVERTSIRIDHSTARRLSRNAVSWIVEVPSGIALRVSRRAASEMIGSGVADEGRL
jgi:hypothetical protein